MYRLVESIKMQNGIVYNLEGHTRRLNRTRRELLECADQWDLRDFFQDIPEYARKGLFKCRLIYGQELLGQEYIRYKPRTVESLKLVDGSHVDYSYKYEDRHEINELLSAREDCDDILIVQDGFITDTSSANIVFLNDRQWITPDKPMLDGTMRQYLLERKVIAEASITVSDLRQFQRFRLINAMTDWDDAPVQLISSIKR